MRHPRDHSPNSNIRLKDHSGHTAPTLGTRSWKYTVLKLFKIWLKKYKRQGGGKGLLQIEATYKVEVINIAECLNTE